MEQKQAVDKIKNEIKDFNPAISIHIIAMMDTYLNMAYGIGFDSGRHYLPHSKPVIQVDKYGNEMREFESCADAGRIMKIDRGSIYKVCAGTHRKKSAGGYGWRFKEINRL